MSVLSDLTDSVALLKADSLLIDAIVNGPASGTGSTVTTPGGNVPTVKKLIAETSELAAFPSILNQYPGAGLTVSINGAATLLRYGGLFGGYKFWSNDGTNPDTYDDTVSGSIICYTLDGETWLISGDGAILLAAESTTLASHPAGLTYDNGGLGATVNSVSINILSYLLLMLGVTEYANLTAANAALAAGQIYFDVALNKLNLTTA